MSKLITTKIDPAKLDLVMRDTDFVIYYDGNPLKTPDGKEIAHPDSRLLKHILIKLTIAGKIDLQVINSFSLFSFYKDMLEKGIDPIAENLDEVLKNDPVLKTKYGTSQKQILYDVSPVLKYLEQNSWIINLMFLGVSVIIQAFDDLISGMENYEQIKKNVAGNSDEINKYLKDLYLNLSPEQKTVINLLTVFHNTGIILPLLLIMSKLSPSEYSNSAVAIHTHYLGETDRYFFTSLLFKESNLQHIKVNWGKPESSFFEFYEQSLHSLEFLGFFEKTRKKISVVHELINQGEHDKLEFKSTFRWDIRQNKKNPAIEHAALKTITAFLNSDGGDLLLGVEDDGNIIGVEKDRFSNDDKFLLHVWTLIKTSLGQDISPYVKTSLEKFNDYTVCRVKCAKSPKPVFLRQKGFDEAFYIRIGPSTGSLDISEALKYIDEHFGEN